MSSIPGAKCHCVKHHVPKSMQLHRHHIWPKAEGGPNTADNLIWLCPTAHVNVHEYLDLLRDTGGVRPSNWREFSLFVRAVADLGWQRITTRSIVP